MQQTAEPSDPDEGLASQIIRARARKGWTQAQLATRADLAVASIGRVEAGKPVSRSTLLAIAAALGGRLQIQASINFGQP